MSVINQLRELGVSITQDEDGWYWQRKLGENALVKGEQRYEGYLDAIDDAVYTFNLIPESFVVPPMASSQRDTWHLDDDNSEPIDTNSYDHYSGHDDF